MPYYIIPLTKFKAFQTRDERTAYLFASLFKLDVEKSDKPARHLIVTSLDRPITDSLQYEDYPLGVGA